MNTIEAVYKRRSVKQFDKTHVLTADEERRLLTAAIQAPTSFNVQHWRMVILRDPALRARIRSEFGGGQPQMTDAALLVLFTGHVKAWREKPERYWSNLPQDVATSIVSAMQQFHEGREWLQRDEAQRSIGMAMQTLMLVAQAMGYQSCPMIGYNIEKVAELIQLPDDHVMGPMVAIGRGVETARPKPGQIPLEELVFENSFA